VYRLLQEMREQEGLVSPPELKRQLEAYASVTLLRLLGYRWPDQPKEADPVDALVDEDGIVCLPGVRGEAPAAESRDAARPGSRPASRRSLRSRAPDGWG